MKVLLTGGSGNLGHTLMPRLLDKGDTPVILDVRAPRDLKKGALFIEGSILDRPKLSEIFRGCDCIVHIAAWHGIHEDRGEKNAYDFFDLNVRGTFEVFEAAVSLGIDKIVFISTTSVYRPDSRYGSSKILAELIAEDYRKHRDMNVITLRPRGFIPYWSHEVYVNYSDWARWFWRGAVHIDDVAAAVILSLDLISRSVSHSSSSSGLTAPMNTRRPISIIGMPTGRVRHSRNTIPNITISCSLTASIPP
jgi:nucleoside-diphosphate-sugar epimerase